MMLILRTKSSHLLIICSVEFWVLVVLFFFRCNEQGHFLTRRQMDEILRFFSLSWNKSGEMLLWFLSLKVHTTHTNCSFTMRSGDIRALQHWLRHHSDISVDPVGLTHILILNKHAQINTLGALGQRIYHSPLQQTPLSTLLSQLVCTISKAQRWGFSEDMTT